MRGLLCTVKRYIVNRTIVDSMLPSTKCAEAICPRILSNNIHHIYIGRLFVILNPWTISVGIVCCDFFALLLLDITCHLLQSYSYLATGLFAFPIHSFSWRLTSGLSFFFNVPIWWSSPAAVFLRFVIVWWSDICSLPNAPVDVRKLQSAPHGKYISLLGYYLSFAKLSPGSCRSFLEPEQDRVPAHLIRLFSRHSGSAWRLLFSYARLLAAKKLIRKDKGDRHRELWSICMCFAQNVHTVWW